MFAVVHNRYFGKTRGAVGLTLDRYSLLALWKETFWEQAGYMMLAEMSSLDPHSLAIIPHP